MNSLTRKEILPSVAQTLVAGALLHGRQNGWEIAVAVVDPHGFLVAFGRTDGVAPPIGEFALDKAYTAGTLRQSTLGFGERMASSPTLWLGLSTRSRFMAWGGGVAVFEDGVCIAGIGVSGAKEAEDIACANAAINSVGLTAV